MLKINIVLFLILVIFSIYIIYNLNFINKQGFQSGYTIDVSGMSNNSAKAFRKAGALNVRGCNFKPEGATPLACYDRCGHRDDKKLWGGDLCTEVNCRKICDSCDDKFYCKWLEEEEKNLGIL